MFWPDQSRHVRPRQMGHCLLYFWMKVAGRHCLCQTSEQSWRTWFDTSWGPKPWLRQWSYSTWLFDWDVHWLMLKPQLSPNALNMLTSPSAEIWYGYAWLSCQLQTLHQPRMIHPPALDYSYDLRATPMLDNPMFGLSNNWVSGDVFPVTHLSPLFLVDIGNIPPF